jgi:hypothetical protein
VQGVEFEAKLRLLPLVAYDMVLGMDWLNTPLGKGIFNEGVLTPLKTYSIPSLHIIA